MKTLKQFYRELQAWIDAGCPEHEAFDADYGLCRNLRKWSRRDIHLRNQMTNSFHVAGLGKEYPFNNDSSGGYFSETHHYKNPARLAWIKEHAA